MAEWIELRSYLHALIEEGRIVRLSIPAKDAETTTADDAGAVMGFIGVVPAPGAEWQVTTEGDVALSVLPVNAPELTGAIGGAKGGKAKTEAKKAASAENGKLGGRPQILKYSIKCDKCGYTDRSTNQAEAARIARKHCNDCYQGNNTYVVRCPIYEFERGLSTSRKVYADYKNENGKVKKLL